MLKEMASLNAMACAGRPGALVIGNPLTDVQHAADAVLHMAGLPLSANLPSMSIMASKMPFVGRGEWTHTRGARAARDQLILSASRL